MKTADQSNAFTAYAAALASALSAIPDPYEEGGNDWRTRLILPDGSRIFLRDDRRNKVEVLPMGQGRLLRPSIGGSLSANPRTMAKRILALLAPGGEWQAAIASADARAERERQAIARSQAAADTLRAAGWDVREGGSAGHFYAHKKAERQTVSSEIQHGGSVTFRNLYVSADEAVAIAAAL